jgi:hypothetical protein
MNYKMHKTHTSETAHIWEVCVDNMKCKCLSIDGFAVLKWVFVFAKMWNGVWWFRVDSIYWPLWTEQDSVISKEFLNWLNYCLLLPMYMILYVLFICTMQLPSNLHASPFPTTSKSQPTFGQALATDPDVSPE